MWVRGYCHMWRRSPAAFEYSQRKPSWAAQVALRMISLGRPVVQEAHETCCHSSGAGCIDWQTSSGAEGASGGPNRSPHRQAAGGTHTLQEGFELQSSGSRQVVLVCTAEATGTCHCPAWQPSSSTSEEETLSIRLRWVRFSSAEAAASPLPAGAGHDAGRGG